MNVELLAPAGSYESMKAAYEAGADAVYIGGTRFGARAYADNPDEEALKRAIDHAHKKERKLYLTVNTLFKERELDELYTYLQPLYCQGLDAVIVQDLGVLSYLRDTFPELVLHASTQMGITGAYGAAFLKEHGASRIVTARELSLAEVRKIHENVDIEIESFVHGALCYCYSGQCLFSSMIGGRSGNRGRCAQPCRLPYELYDGKMRIGEAQDKYLLSPKDICTLDLLPQIVESGVCSLKIEGRMKRQEYTAGVTRIYRRYLALLLENGAGAYRVNESDKRELMDLYNRGGFSEGYWKRSNGAGMMSPQRPNHWGIKAAKAARLRNGKMQWNALESLSKGDVLELRGGGRTEEFTLKEDIKKGGAVVLPGQAARLCGAKDAVLYRTRSEGLLQELKQNYIDREIPEKINGKLILSVQKFAILEVVKKDVSVTVRGAQVQEAKTRPLGREEIERQMRKTGGSGYAFDKLEIIADGAPFLPMQALNELRRNALAALDEAIFDRYRRENVHLQEPSEGREAASVFNAETAAGVGGEQPPKLHVSLERLDVLPEVLGVQETAAVEIDCNAFASAEEFFERSKEIAKQCHDAGKSCVYILPWIFRDQARRYYQPEKTAQALACYDAVMMRNQEEAVFLRELGYQEDVWADWNLYTWNTRSRMFWRAQGVSLDTAPTELNERELRIRGCRGSEMIVYGYQPLMVSAQCQQKNARGCSGVPKTLYLKDRKQKQFAVKNHCAFCYNIIYNSTPLHLIGSAKEVLRLQPCSVRLQFTTENAAQVREIVRAYAEVFCRGAQTAYRFKEFTRGHFERGVE